MLMSNFRTNVLEVVRVAWVSHFLWFLQVAHRPSCFHDFFSGSSYGIWNLADIANSISQNITSDASSFPFILGVWRWLFSLLFQWVIGHYSYTSFLMISTTENLDSND
jgi:hypothetical protein